MQNPLKPGILVQQKNLFLLLLPTKPQSMYHWASHSALSLFHKENLKGTLNIISNRGKMRVSSSLSQTQTPNPMFNANHTLSSDSYRWLYFKEYSKVCSSEILQDTSVSIHHLQQNKNTIKKMWRNWVYFVYQADISEAYAKSSSTKKD